MSADIQFLLLLLIAINLIIVYCEDPLLFAEDTLRNSHGDIIFSSVIFRHGERAPIKMYPNDPYGDESYRQKYWPQGRGQLSKIGKLQEYNLGKWFRKRYDFLIPSGYKYDLLKVESSDYDRTIMSAECFLAGFFPPSSSEMWADDGLRWQPIPIRAIPSELDDMIDFKVNCERFELEKDLFNESPEAQDFYLKHQKLFNYVATHSGLNMSSSNVLQAIDNIFYLHDALLIQESKNLSLPVWTESIYPEPSKRFASLSLLLVAYSRQMRRIKAGPLIGKLVEEMELKIKKKINSTFHFYSGHDTTISGLLTALEMYRDIFIWPPYSTSVIVELRQKEQNYVVTILYRNSTTSPPQLLRLRDCDYVCTWDNFKALIQDLIPENIDDECESNLVKKDTTRNDHIFQQMIKSLGLDTETKLRKPININTN